MDSSKRSDCSLADVFGELITPQILELVRARLLNPKHQIAIRKDLSSQTKKLVLMLVEKAAPYTIFTLAEAAILHGVSEPALRNRVKDPTRHPRRLNFSK